MAFGLKIGLFPFHFWLPAVYVGSHAPVAAILSGALANIGSYGILRFGGYILPDQLAFRDTGAAGARDGEHYLRGTPGGRPAVAGRGDGIFGYRTGGIHPYSYSYWWAGRVCGGGYLRGGQLAQQAAGLSGDRAAGLDGRGGVRRRGFQHRGVCRPRRVS